MNSRLPPSRSRNGASARRARAIGAASTASSRAASTPNASAAAGEPEARPLGAERIRRGEELRAAAHQGARRLAGERLGEQHARVRPHRRQLVGAARGKEAHRADAQPVEQADELVLDHVGERADDEQRRRRVVRLGRQLGDERLQAGVLALRERRLDTAPRVVEHAHAGEVRHVQPFGGALEIELDDLGRARADEEERADVGAPGEQLPDDAVELLVGVGEAGEVALLEDRRGEARLGEDHHAGGALQQVGAGPRADHEEEGVLHLPVQPHDAGQAAEHLALPAFAQHGQGVRRRRGERRRHVAPGERGQGGGDGRAHRAASATRAAARSVEPPSSLLRSRRARRSFQMNWPAFTT
jgi:hypothetical protein